MIKKYLFFFHFLLVNISYAQNINGVVYDELQQPIVGALVFVDGSSIGALTNENGQFEITALGQPFSNLVVSYLGYENFLVKNPFETSFHKIILVPKINALNEITVTRKKKRFKRTDMLKLFSQEFLGSTIAGKYCKILNESDIQLTYNIKKKQLMATSEVPVRIYNPFLGYQIEYRIKECYIEFEWTSIKSRDIKSWKFSGSSYFKDMTNDSTSYAAQRRMSYECSQMQFFRNLSQHKLGDDNFSLLHGSRYCKPEQYFTVMPREHDYIIVVNNNQLTSKENFQQSFILEYPGKSDSEVYFPTKTFRIDQFGNYTSYKSISFSGEITNKRIGDLLPLNYVPHK